MSNGSDISRNSAGARLRLSKATNERARLAGFEKCFGCIYPIINGARQNDILELDQVVPLNVNKLFEVLP
jgi:hypothetical protein